MRNHPQTTYGRTIKSLVILVGVATWSMAVLALLSTKQFSDGAETLDPGAPIDGAEDREPVADPAKAPWSSGRTSGDTGASALGPTPPTGLSVAPDDDAERVTGSEPPPAITVTSSDVPTPGSLAPASEFVPRTTTSSPTSSPKPTAPTSSLLPPTAPVAASAPATSSPPVTASTPPVTATAPTNAVPAAPATTAVTVPLPTSPPQSVPTVPPTTSPAITAGPAPVDRVPPGQARKAAKDAADDDEVDD